MSLFVPALALGLSVAATAVDASVVQYTYQTAQMTLAPADGGYSAPGFDGTLPATRSFSFGFSVDTGVLGGRLGNATLSVVSDWASGTVAIATRNGRVIASSDSLGLGWISSSFPAESLGSRLTVNFDARGGIGSFGFGTDGEGASYSFGGPTGDLFAFATILNWTPAAPVWTSAGPGSWTRTPPPAPVPLPAPLLALLAGLAVLVALAARPTVRGRNRRALRALDARTRHA
jgi:hypothetical protein